MDQKKNIGEWQYDSNGRRYRIDEAGCIEYAMILQTTSGAVYADEIEKHNKRLAESKKRQEPAKDSQIMKVCPFKAGRIRCQCDSGCAFYGDTSCRLSMPDVVPHEDTEGMLCPIARQCTKDCAMYNNGCTLIELIGAKAQKGKVENG